MNQRHQHLPHDTWMTAPRGVHRGASARISWLLAGLATVFGTLYLALLAMNSRSSETDVYAYWGANAVMAIVFPMVGALIVSRHPHHALGWLFCLIGIAVGLGGVAAQYASYALIVESSSLPGVVVAAWLSWWITDIGFFCTLLVPHLFPTGRALSPRWRPLVWLGVGVIVATTILTILMPGPLQGHPMVENPTGVTGTGRANEVLSALAGGLLVIVFATGIASLVVRYRRSRGVERQQLRWFIWATALIPLGLIGNTIAPTWAWLIGAVTVALLPLAIGVAILRYRLYDIDIIINRTLVYGVLTVGVIGFYVLVVGYLGALFHTGDNLAVSLIATGLVAVLFQPLRVWVQRGVNRLMYGERDDPYRVLTRLGERLKMTTAPEAALTAIVDTVAQALKLPYAAIVLQGDAGASTIVAARGLPTGEPICVPLSYSTAPIGQLVLSPRAPGEPLGPAERQLLDGVARHAEAAAYAMQLTADLQRSRERLVNAREEERRRLRRDLHDGLGPQLATVTLKLDAARNLLASQPAVAETLLAELKVQTQTAIADIRRLVYDLRPPALDDLGLVPAIREQAAGYSQNGLMISVDAPENLPPLPAAVEVAVFRITQEALTNVVRHAQARACHVRLAVDTELLLEVIDDGTGLPNHLRAGVGLTSMRERVAELGGRFLAESLPSCGTRVLVHLPLPEDEEER